MLGSIDNREFVIEFPRDTVPLSAGDVVKHIQCPKCRRGIYLRRHPAPNIVFEIDTDETNSTWCGSHAVICKAPKCGAEFWIIWNEIVWIRK